MLKAHVLSAGEVGGGIFPATVLEDCVDLTAAKADFEVRPQVLAVHFQRGCVTAAADL